MKMGYVLVWDCSWRISTLSQRYLYGFTSGLPCEISITNNVALVII